MNLFLEMIEKRDIKFEITNRYYYTQDHFKFYLRIWKNYKNGSIMLKTNKIFEANNLEETFNQVCAYLKEK